MTELINSNTERETKYYKITSDSRGNAFVELQEFVKENGNDDNLIYYTCLPVKPSKVNLRPIYGYEVTVVSQKMYHSLIIGGYKIWG